MKFQIPPQDHVRMILVYYDDRVDDFAVEEMRVRPKRPHIEKIICAEEKAEGVSLYHVLPGHSMRAVRDEFYNGNKKWTFSTPHGCLDVYFEGRALIYGMKKSELADCNLSIEEVRNSLTIVE